MGTQPSQSESNAALSRKGLRYLLFNFCLFSVVLFGSAGTLYWFRAWIFIFTITMGTGAIGRWLYKNNKGLLAERIKSTIQRDQPLIDKIQLTAFMALYALSYAFIGYDVFNWQWLPKPSATVSGIGLALVIAGTYAIFLTMQANAFAAPVVKLQAEREHKVVDTGVYKFVRHPMYFGVFLEAIGSALWLESYAGAIVMLLPMGALIVRILSEEKFLEGHLAGYLVYKAKVPYRLLPFVW
jgi:protein-S-isoprenylcysteine O-methyltransferase Ste14